MKRFIINIALFGIILLIIVGVFELFLMRFSNEFSYKHNYLKKHSNDIEVLILGGSQSSNSINPWAFKEKTFDAAITARYLYMDYKMAEEFVPQMKNLKAVVLTVSNLILYRSYKYHFKGSMEQLLEDEYRCMYLKYMGYHYGTFDYKYWPETVNSKLNYLGRIFMNNDQQRNRCDSLGYQVVPLHAKDWENAQVPTEVDYSDSNLEKAFEENVEYLKQISLLCKERHAKLILVHIPYFKTAQAAITQTDEQFFSKMISEVKSVNNDVEILNLMKDSRFGPDDFFNAIHLNDNGAKKIAAIIDEKI